jgi:hypothetical protein
MKIVILSLRTRKVVHLFCYMLQSDGLISSLNWSSRLGKRRPPSSRFFSHLIPYFYCYIYHRAQLRCGATRAYHQRPKQGGLALAPTDKDQRRGPPQRPQQPFLFSPYFLYLSSSSATLRRHSRIPSATRSSAISSGRQSLLGSHGDPLSGSARSTEA